MHRTAGKRWATLPTLVSLVLSACGLRTYPYNRQDTFYVDGIKYSSNINAGIHVETGFSPDLGFKRANTTNFWEGRDNVYQIALPDGAGIWITNDGPPAQEKALEVGATFKFRPSAIIVDNIVTPTRWHAISVRCDADRLRKECYDETMLHILERGAQNEQQKAAATWDYWRDEHNIVRVFGQMTYYVCDESSWRNNKRLVSLFESQKAFTVTYERQHENAFTAREALTPCDTKNRAFQLTNVGNGNWNLTQLPVDSEIRYIGKTQYKEIHDFYNSGFEMDNALFFRIVTLPSGQTVQISPVGAVTLAYDPSDRRVYVLGINSYSYMKLFADQ
jgi:hypothetical protein